MTIPAPDLSTLRQPGLKWFAKGMAIGGVCSFIVPAVIYFTYMKPKYQRYDEFFKNADPYWMMEHMCKRNLLQACPQNLQKMIDEA